MLHLHYFYLHGICWFHNDNERLVQMMNERQGFQRVDREGK